VAAVSLCGDARTAQLERVAPLVVDAVREIGRTLHPEFEKPGRAPQPAAPATETWSPEARSRLTLIGQRSGWI
jgi:hypothetical protein